MKKNKTIDKDTAIFFPPEKETLPDPPNFAKLVFLNRSLLKSLQNLPELEGKSLATIYDTLSHFTNIHQYRLDEIIRFVVNSLGDNTFKISRKRKKGKPKNVVNKNQMDFLLWLWKLYKQGFLTSEGRTLRNSIPFPDCIGIMRKASSLFMGANYDNPIPESLFPGQKKLLAGKPKFLKNADLADSKSFLRILGAKEYPPIGTVDLKLSEHAAYKSYLIENMHYPLKLLRSSNYQYFDSSACSRAHFGSASVAYIDNLEKILETSPTQAILDWIMSDKDLQSAIRDKYEKSESYAEIRSGGEWDYRKISGQCLPSYMRYIFTTSKWIEVDGKRYAPGECLFSERIGAALAPHVVNPDLKRFAGQNAVNVNYKTRYWRELLIELGAGADFASLDTRTFYSLLLDLPEKDPDGKISRAIYNNLLNKKGLVKGLDEKCPEYKKFLDEGLVYCKSTGRFEPVGEVKYLKDNISSQLQKNWKFIDIYIRESYELIQQYFGVPPLDVKSEVEGTPELHPAYDEFAADFRGFLPYAFCKRLKLLESDSRTGACGDIDLANRLKSWNINLCQKVIARYDDKLIELEDNAFVMTKDKIYLCAPAYCGNLTALKGNLKFCSAIADIFRAASGSQDDSLYQFVRTIYGYPDSQRDAVILEDFGSLEALSRSRELLDMVVSFKESFTRACESYAGELDKKLMELIDKLDFNDLSSSSNANYLISIFKKLKIDVIDFRNKHAIHVNLIPWYESQLQQMLDTNKNLYKNGLFSSLKNESLETKKEFRSKLNEYETYSFQIMNDANYDPASAFNNKFGSYLNFAAGIDADKEWRANLDNFEKDKEKDIVTDLLDDRIFDSLLYFGETSELEKIYKKKLDSHKKENTGENQRLLINLDQVKVEVISTKALQQRISGDQKARGSVHHTIGLDKTDKRSENGADSEELVYNLMMKSPDLYKNIKWVSENAKKKRNNPDGEAGDGYDLKYIDANGNEKFAEVKSSLGDEISFIMSDNELNIAESTPDKYEIWFVSSMRNSPKVRVIRGLFKYGLNESRYNNPKFTCGTREWIINCKEDIEDKP